MSPALEAFDLHVSAQRAGSSARSRRTPILRGVSLTVPAGVGTGLVGVSGSGKSTLLRSLLALERPDGGTITFGGRTVTPGPLRSLRWFRRAVQYVPQDPASSLDPRMTVEQLLREPLVCLGVRGHHGRLIEDALRRVDLGTALHGRRPPELSGGQNQRVAIARALVLSPALLLADEPVSGLDLPLRNQVLDVLGALVESRQVGLLMVSHDLDAIAAVCERTSVLDAGSIVEEGATSQLLGAPRHPAARALTAARLRQGELLP